MNRRTKLDRESRPPGIYFDGKIALMERGAFDLLREYSSSYPTGQTLGKRWKRQPGDLRNVYGDDSKGWVMGEYVLPPLDGDEDRVRIIWRDIIVADEIETRYFVGRECWECAWWHIPHQGVIEQPEPEIDSTSHCPKCGVMAHRFDPFKMIQVARARPRVILWKPSTWRPGNWRRLTCDNRSMAAAAT